MTHKCLECGATVAEETKICAYCGAVQEDNSDQALLDELINIRRKYEIAIAQNNKIAFRELLADGFTGNEIDAGEPNVFTKAQMLEWDYSDKNFFSYSASDEKLLERTVDAATVSCTDTICRHYQKGSLIFPDGDDNSYSRAKMKFVRRNNRWQMSAIETISIDESGHDIT